MASGAGSVAFQDVTGKTIPKGRRGRLLAHRAAVNPVNKLALCLLFLCQQIAATVLLQHDLLLLFGNKQVAEVATPEGKEALRTATLDAVRKVVASEGGDPEALEAVYFTSFVMQ